MPTPKEIVEKARAALKEREAIKLKEQQALVPVNKPTPPPTPSTGNSFVDSMAKANQFLANVTAQPTSLRPASTPPRNQTIAKKASDALTNLHISKSVAAQKAMVGFLLDRSGSMAMVKGQTIQGFNDFVKLLKERRSCALSFWQFDGDPAMCFERLYEAVPIEMVPLLTPDKYIPRGGTPLIESALAAIRRMDEMLQGRTDRPKVVIVIQTDGGDTSGLSWDILRRVIQAKQRLGWQFLFIGAALDAYLMGSSMGVSLDATMSYDNTPEGTHAAFVAAAKAAQAYIDDKAPNAEAKFTAQDRRLAGDKFAPPKLLK